ncbi:hemoglobin subunit zeta-like [Lepus europaeus]|uniref:hemoglobin subunit zeta-like n=1 Tax=Lepus europaeus TaxID=9983 RepID=UPI002B4922E1|nr:hemoglobin subunit zeta-like [Lepus europaeus]
MSLTNSEKSIIVSSWDKVSSQAEAIGTETLERLFHVYPWTRTYFPHVPVHRGSEQVRVLGAKLAAAVDNAVKNMDDLDGALSTLRDTLPYVLRVDPQNFRLLSNCLLVTLATYLSRDFTAESHLAWEKFLRRVSIILTEE